MSTVVVISPHPDDEAVGCGGTIRKHVLDGDTVEVVYVTSGEAGGHGVPPDETAAIREGEAHIAAAVLGVAHLEFWHEPDGKVRAHNALLGRMIDLLSRTDVSAVYAPHAYESHPDHRAAARVTLDALRRVEGDLRPSVRTYEIWTPLRNLHHIVDITDTIEDKVRAIQAYRSQCEVMRFDEAFKSLARYRGEMHCWPTGDYAEVFEVLRP